MGKVAYLVRDLLFTSKIRETATQLGLELRAARDAASLKAAAESAEAVILDLRLPEALAALELLAADPRTRDVPKVGFIDHENVEVMREASERGCDKVLAKGKFSSELPALLSSLSQR
jgi:CheY-like chemotaxis protein